MATKKLGAVTTAAKKKLEEEAKKAAEEAKKKAQAAAATQKAKQQVQKSVSTAVKKATQTAAPKATKATAEKTKAAAKKTTTGTSGKLPSPTTNTDGNGRSASVKYTSTRRTSSTLKSATEQVNRALKDAQKTQRRANERAYQASGSKFATDWTARQKARTSTFQYSRGERNKDLERLSSPSKDRPNDVSRFYLRSGTVAPMDLLRADTISGRNPARTMPGQSESQKARAAARKKQAEINQQRYARIPISAEDRKLSAQDQMTIQQARNAWAKARDAGDLPGMRRAHEIAETVRYRHGYTGGETGDTPYKPTLSMGERLSMNREGETALRQAMLDADRALGPTAKKLAAARIEEVKNSARNKSALQKQRDREEKREEDRRRILSDPSSTQLDAHGRPMPGDGGDAWRAYSRIEAAGYGIAGGLAKAAESVVNAARNNERERMRDEWRRMADRIPDYEGQLRAYDELKAQGYSPSTNRDVLVKQLEAARHAQKQLEQMSLDPRSDWFDPTQAGLRGLPATADESLGDRWMRTSEEARQRALQDLGSVGQFLTNTAISGYQMLPSVAAAMIPGAGPAIGSAIMGGQAMGQKAYDLEQAGGTASGEVLLRGLGSGLIEAATEAIPLHRLARIARGGTGRTILSNMMTQAGIEGAEEAASYLGNYAADWAARDPNREMSLAGLAEQALSGAVLGGVFGGVASVAGMPARGGSNVPAQTASVQTAPIAPPTPAATTESARTEQRDTARQRLERTLEQRRAAQTQTATTEATDLPEAVRQQMNRVRERMAERAAQQAAQQAGKQTPVRQTEAPTTRRQMPGSDAPRSQREILERNISSLGENGRRAILSQYQDGEDVLAYRRGFQAVYDQALNGKDDDAISIPRSLSTLQARAAADAGRNDRAAQVERERAAAENARVAKNGGLRDYRQIAQIVGKKQAKTLDETARMLGREVRYVSAGEMKNATAQGEERADGIIQINRDYEAVTGDKPDAVRWIMGHELFHTMKRISPEHARAFQDAIMQNEENQRRVEAVLEAYLQNGAEISRAEVMEEIAADISGDIFNEDSDFLERFIARNRGNHGVLSRLWQAIKSMAAKLTGRQKQQADEAMTLLENAMDETARRVKDLPGAEVFDADAGETRASIVADRNEKGTRADKAYMDAVDRGETEAAQRMVDEAAAANGYLERWAHGSADAMFLSFNLNKAKGARAVFLSDRGTASQYAGTTHRGIETRLIGKEIDNVDDALSEIRRISDSFSQPKKSGEVYKIGRREYNSTELIEYANKLRRRKPGGVYGLFVSPGRSLKVDAKGAHWDRIKSEYGDTTDKIGQWAENHGYDSVEITNVYDGGFSSIMPSDILLVFDSTRLKSTDPVTYDDNGEVIPLSQRFQVENPDIRYSIKIPESGNRDRSLRQDGSRVLDDSQKEALATAGLYFDDETGSVTKFSVQTWRKSDYVKNREEVARILAGATGRTYDEAAGWIDDVTSIAAIIAGDPARLDYIQNPYVPDEYGRIGEDSSIVGNAEYGGSNDFSTFCPKRRAYTGTLDAIQKELPDGTLTRDDYLAIREMMDKRGYEVTCGPCYVEASRSKIGEYAKKFLDSLRAQGIEDMPTMADVNTTFGLERLRAERPEIYAKYVKHMNRLAQRKPKLFMRHTQYNGEILTMFQGMADKVAEYNKNGGFRLQSFSDFEIVHLIDAMQVILDMSRVQLAGQAYTKVPEFAEALGGTGIKINLSLIAAGTDENGQLIFDDKEGMPIADALELRDRHPDNVGTVVVVFTSDQIKAALADDRIDFVLPFHHSQWKKTDFQKMGLREGSKTFQAFQTDYSKTVKENIRPSEYWDDTKTGRENAEAYLRMCAEKGRKPKFAKLHGKDFLLVKNADGSWALPDGPIGDGYYKLLIDYKMYNHITGANAPQRPVVPEFDLVAAKRMLKEYTGGHETFPVAEDVVRDFLAQRKDGGSRYSIKIPSDRVQQIDPREIRPVNEITDRGKADYLADTFRSSGWNGRPIVAVNLGNQYTALIGSHRIFAASEAGIPVDAVVLDYSDDIAPLLTANDDETRARIARDLQEAGTIPEYIADLIVREDDLNWENYDVPYEDQARYSIKSPGVTGADAAALARENRELRKKLEYWKAQVKRTDRRDVDPKSLRQLARRLRGDYNTEMGADEIAARLGEIYNGISHDMAYEEAQALAQALATDMIEQASVTEDYLYHEYEPMRKYFRETPLVLTPTDQREITDYNDFRKAMMGKLRLKTGERSNVDQVYQELSMLWPEFFDEQRDITSLDQVERIAQVLEDIYRRDEVNPFAGDMAGPANFLASEIMDSFLDVPAVKKTFADRAYERQARKSNEQRQRAVQRERERGERSLAEAEMNARWREAELKATHEWLSAKDRHERKKKYDAAIKAVREQRDRKIRAEQEKRWEAVAAIRQQRDRKLSEQAAHHRETVQNMRQRQKERELRARIIRHSRDLSKKLLRPSDNQHVPQELRGAAAAVLESINLESVYTYDPVTGRRSKDPNGTPAKRTQAFQELRIAYQQIAEAERLDALALDPDLMANITRVESFRDTPIGALSLEQLDTVWRAIKAMENSITTANKMLAQSRFETVKDASMALKEDNGHKNKRTKYREAPGRFQKLLSVDMLTVQQYFHRMGKAGDEIFRMLRGAQDKQIVLLRDTAEDVHEITKGVNTRKLGREKKTFTFGEESVTFTKAQIMSLYALMKRPKAVEHILVGGMRPGDYSSGLKESERVDPIRLEREQIESITNSLTKEEKGVADRLQKILEKRMAAAGNEASMAVYGYEKFGDEHYFPIRTDKNQTVDDQAKGAQAATLAGRGFAQQTQPNASNAVIIDDIFDVVSDHVAEMSTYAAFLPAMEDLKRIFNFRFRAEEGGGDVKAIIETVHGKHGTNYWRKLTEDLNNGIQGINDSPFGGLVGAYKASAIGANLRVIIQQPTAILRAMVEVNPADLIAAAGSVTPGAWERAKRYSPIAEWKSWGYFDAYTGRTVRDILFEDGNGLNRANNFLMSGAGAMDSLAWTHLWRALEIETKRTRKDLTPKTEEFYQAVAERFNRVIDRTQVVDGILQRSQIMRSPDGLTKMATSFMTEPTKVYNMLIGAAYDARNAATAAERKQAGVRLARTALALTTSVSVNAAMQSVVDALRDDDNDETYLEKFLQAFLGIGEDAKDEREERKNYIFSNLAEGFNPVNFVPFVRDLWSLVQGYSVDRMDMEAIGRLISEGQSMMKALEGGGKITTANATMRMIGEMGRLFGVPAANIKRDSLAIVQTVLRGTGAYKPLFEVAKFLYRIDNPNNANTFLDIIYAARRAGDMTAYWDLSKELLETLGKDQKWLEGKMTTRLAEDGNLAGIEAEQFRMFSQQVGNIKGDENGTKQENIISYIDGLDLSDEQKSALFRTQYDSDKNNPWA